MQDWVDPGDITPMFGKNAGWSRSMERIRNVGEPCEVCFAERNWDGRIVGGVIDDGSKLYCGACGKSGFEFRLEQDRLKPMAEAPAYSEDDNV